MFTTLLVLFVYGILLSIPFMLFGMFVNTGSNSSKANLLTILKGLNMQDIKALREKASLQQGYAKPTDLFNGLTSYTYDSNTYDRNVERKKAIPIPSLLDSKNNLDINKIKNYIASHSDKVFRINDVIILIAKIKSKEYTRIVLTDSMLGIKKIAENKDSKKGNKKQQLLKDAEKQQTTETTETKETKE